MAATFSNMSFSCCTFSSVFSSTHICSASFSLSMAAIVCAVGAWSRHGRTDCRSRPLSCLSRVGLVRPAAGRSFPLCDSTCVERPLARAPSAPGEFWVTKIIIMSEAQFSVNLTEFFSWCVVIIEKRLAWSFLLYDSTCVEHPNSACSVCSRRILGNKHTNPG